MFLFSANETERPCLYSVILFTGPFQKRPCEPVSQADALSETPPAGILLGHWCELHHRLVHGRTVGPRQGKHVGWFNVVIPTATLATLFRN